MSRRPSGTASTRRTGTPARAKRRSRGSIDLLPSGSYRVRVYARRTRSAASGTIWVETAPTAAAAEKVRTKLLAELDERRNPRTKATVDKLIHCSCRWQQ